MTNRIEAKVAQILSATDLAINKGAAAGVTVGMRFAVLSDRGVDIRDPDSEEILGSVEVAKTLIKIVSVTERVSVGRTFRTRGSSSFTSLLAMNVGEKHESLRTDERRLQQELDPKDSFINIGDVAVQYTGEEYTGLVFDF